MVRITEYTDYKAFIRDLIRSLPKRGHGQYLRIAKLLKVNSSMVSSIFKGKADLSVDQGLLVADEYNLSPLERDYFINMIHLARAGRSQTRAFFEGKLKADRQRFLDLKERFHNKTVLDEKDQAIFYSHWYFAGIQLLTMMPGFDHPKAIATHLGLTLKTVTKALEFLVSTGLCTFDGSRYGYGITRTYVDRDSFFVDRHRSNWRMKAMQQFQHLGVDEIAYTCPMTVSAEDFKKIREEIARLIESANQISGPSPSEELVCLNVDLFKVRAS